MLESLLWKVWHYWKNRGSNNDELHKKFIALFNEPSVDLEFGVGRAIGQFWCSCMQRFTGGELQFSALDNKFGESLYLRVSWFGQKNKEKTTMIMMTW